MEYVVCRCFTEGSTYVYGYIWFVAGDNELVLKKEALEIMIMLQRVRTEKLNRSCNSTRSFGTLALGSYLTLPR